MLLQPGNQHGQNLIKKKPVLHPVVGRQRQADLGVQGQPGLRVRVPGQPVLPRETDPISKDKRTVSEKLRSHCDTFKAWCKKHSSDKK